jgi:hypothetical protein
MGKFSDSPYYALEDFLGVQIPYGYEYPTTAHLAGGKCSGIIAENSYGFDLYLKTDDGYYRINLVNKSGSPDGDYFTFIVPTGTYVGSEKTIEQLVDYAGYELYFRKEGLFYDFINAYVPATYGELCQPKINTDKFYAYFGKMYVVGDNEIMVKYEGFSKYVNELVPENNRNDLLTEFISVCFDRIYGTQYNLLKNILTLSDPKEVTSDYLYYIAGMYNMSLPENLSDIKKREYVAALPELLKRKGTYTSLYIIWKIMCSDTTNYLNVYERWHDWYTGDGMVGYIPYGKFSDVLYTFNTLYNKTLPTGGAGIEYYYSGSNTNFSTLVTTPAATWTIAHNLSNQYPFVQIFNDSNEVVIPADISYDTSKSLTVSFNESGVSTPDLVAGHAVTFIPSGTSKTEIVSVPSSSWVIAHNLGVSFPMVQVINGNNKMVQPDEIIFTDTNNLTINFSDPVQGRAIIGVTSESYSETIAVSASTWTINHNLDTSNILVQVTDDQTPPHMIIPGKIEIINSSTIEITFSTLPDLVAGNVVVYTSAGASPYPIYEYGEKMLSPHYLVEIDLTNEPFNNEYIINEALITELISRWEEMRPVCKYSHYRELISPVSNFSGQNIQLYTSTDKKAHLYTRCCQPVADTVDSSTAAIFKTYTNRKTWNVNHNLNSSNVIIQCFDLNQNMMIPTSITLTSANAVTIEWDSAVAGFAYISKEDAVDTFSSSTTWSHVHDLADTISAGGMLIQQTVYDTTPPTVFMPLTVTATDVNEMTVTLSVASAGSIMETTGSYAASASEELTSWSIPHLLDSEAVQVQFYNENMEVVYPYNIQIVDRNTVNATFNDLIKPSVVIKSIGLAVAEIDSIYAAINYARLGSGTSNTWDPILNNGLQTDYNITYDINPTTEKMDSDQYYIKVVINTPIDMTITEAGLFDSSGNILFYTSCNEIFKPADVELILWYRIDKTST